jgi:hypothetical protein
VTAFQRLLSAAIALVIVLFLSAVPSTAASGGAAQQEQGAAQSGGEEQDSLTAGARFTAQELRAAPGARDVWALLEHWIPTVISARLDVGGSATGTQGLFSARATTWQENVYRLDGVDVTDPAVRGASGFFYDYDAFSGVAASWGTQPAAVATGGVLLDMKLKSGGAEWHGTAQGYFEFDALQASNLSDELAAQGVELASDIDYLSDVSFQAGGPLAGERAGIFVSYRDWRISQAVPQFERAVTTSLPVFTVKLSARPGDADALSVFFSRQSYTNAARNGGPLVAPEATSVEDSSASVLGGNWHREFEGGALRWLDVRGSLLDIDLALLAQPGASGQSQLDIITQVRSGAAPLQIDSTRRRYAVDAELGMAAATATVRNDIVAGLHYQHAPTDTDFSAVGDVNIFTSEGAPVAAQLLNTPVMGRQNARAVGLFFQDDLSIGRQWRASLGLRYDDWSGSLPAQASPSGNFTPGREFTEQGGIVGWRGIAPRATLAFDAFAGNELVLIAGFAQYVHQLSTATVGFANPNSVSVAVVSWQDANNDGQFQPGEGGSTMTVAGGAFGSVDPGLRAPLTRELRAGLEIGLPRGWRARTDLWYRKDQRLFDDVEIGLQDDDFATTQVLDPGRDNILGSGDEGGLTVFNQVDNFGGNERLLTTVEEKIVTYRGMDIGIQREWADNWELRAVLTLGLARGASGKSGLVPGDAGGTSDLFNDPNSVINAGINGDARMFWDRPYVLKIYGTYVLPHGIVVAGVLRSWAGAPRGRILPVPLNQGIVNVWAEPRGALREAVLTTADVRVAKDFTMRSGMQVSIYADVFNISNAGTVTRSLDTFPLFGTAAEIVPPFVTRFGARFGF